MQQNQLTPSLKRIVKIIKATILRNPSAMKASMSTLITSLKTRIAQEHETLSEYVHTIGFRKHLRLAIKEVLAKLTLDSEEQFSDKEGMTQEVIVDSQQAEDHSNIQSQAHPPRQNVYQESQSDQGQVLSNVSPHSEIFRQETLASYLPIQLEHNIQTLILTNVVQVGSLPVPNIEEVENSRPIVQTISSVQTQIQEHNVLPADPINLFINPWLVHTHFAEERARNQTDDDGPSESRVKRLIDSEMRKYRSQLDLEAQYAPRTQLKLTSLFQKRDEKLLFQPDNMGRVVQNKQTTFGLVKMNNVQFDYFENNSKDLQVAEIRYVKMIKTEKLKAIKALSDDQVLNELTGISFNERKKLYYIELKKNNLLRKH